MKIGILEAGILNDDLKSRFDPYHVMFRNLLERANPDFEYVSWSVIEGGSPDSILDCDGWIITGSRHGVYENLDWMIKLEGFIQEVNRASMPLVGICFGHQIIAKALGGRVVKSDKGWGVGLHQYAVEETPDWLEDDQDQIGIYAFHQDQVVEKPPGATVLLSSEFCPYAGLKYANHIISVQGHPEFEPAYETALLDIYGGKIVPVPDVDKARDSMDEGQNAETDRLAKWIVRFFQKSRH
ncbi:MAG: GMP synthase-like glutamine amidotransferase [Gammaproteobacteria bacterium]|jgi:GMP synthase-like glutamine amidotransferase